MRIENFKVEVDFLLLRPQRRVTFSQRPGSRVHIGSCIFLGGPYVLGLCRTLNPHLVLGDHFPVCTFFSESRVLCLSFLTLHRKLQGLYLSSFVDQGSSATRPSSQDPRIWDLLLVFWFLIGLQVFTEPSVQGLQWILGYYFLVCCF